MNTPILEFHPTSRYVAELTITSTAPQVTFAAGEERQHHIFGVTSQPRFRLERPFTPDDAWSVEVDPSGLLAKDIAAQPCAIEAELDDFFERELDEASRRLLCALPTGRYRLVRSLRKPHWVAKILLGNEMVPAPPHHQCLLHAKETYAAVFGAEANLIPATSGLLIGVTVLAYVGADRFDGLWFFDLHGAAAPAPASKEIAVVLPLDGPLVIDGMGDYRRKGEDKVLREGWASKRGPQFVQWLVETRNG